MTCAHSNGAGAGADQTEAANAGNFPRILVLLAAYDGAKWIGSQIQSILCQEQVDLCLAIQDDGSSDATVAEVGKIAASDARIRLGIADAPSGSAAQNFFSLIRTHEAIGFDYVALSDQDDLWNPDKLFRSAAALHQSGGCAASSQVIAFWADGRTKVLTQNPAITRSDFLFEGAGQGCTFLLTAQFYKRVRAFLLEHATLTRAIRYHDWSIYALSRTWDLRWTFIAAPTLNYRQHAANDTGARTSMGGIAFRLSRIRSGWYREQLLAIAQLCHAAGAANPLISDWNEIVSRPRGLRRQIAIVATCVSGGRRRLSDNIVLIVCALLGTI